MNFRFVLSQGLFSSADIDTGTRLLLKVLSNIWDEDIAQGHPLPASVLDAGSGVGVIGVCAAAALAAPRPPGALPCCVRSQDRDELARDFTEYNARQNGVPPALLSAHTEPLLAGPPGAARDRILSHIPAKAGEPVLADFVSRSAALLNAGGRVLLVAVNPLADFFRTRIGAASLPLYREVAGKGHTVLLYGPPEKKTALYPAPEGGKDLLSLIPAYLRRRGSYETEGVSYSLDTCYGAASFDSPGGAVLAATKLLTRLGIKAPPPGKSPLPVLIHGEDQGHFPVWLINWAAKEKPGAVFPFRPLVLSGRTILALEAGRHNTLAALGSLSGEGPGKAPDGAALCYPALDLSVPETGAPPLPEPAGGYPLITVFPEPVPQTDRLGSYWEGFNRLLSPGGLVLAGLSASEAERLNRKKPKNFIRMGDIKRKGFRALAYRKE
ncbi:MAG: methyltransferase [Treponema sp.]|nr:methyltransferase [Treponema sp.]